MEIVSRGKRMVSPIQLPKADINAIFTKLTWGLLDLEVYVGDCVIMNIIVLNYE